MSYTSSTLIFSDDKITISGSNIDVMMDWEAPIMSASAAYVTQGGGNILEVGFGMGISANYIQSHSISSHTIIENHPQVISKSREWASGKSNVTIVSQSWQEVTQSLGTFDGIFFDDFGGEYEDISSSLQYLTKSGTKMTFWNNYNSASNPINPSADLQEITVTPTANNSYWTGSIYYMPKLEF